jgi:hypothetical protein
MMHADEIMLAAKYQAPIETPEGTGYIIMWRMIPETSAVVADVLLNESGEVRRFAQDKISPSPLP